MIDREKIAELERILREVVALAAAIEEGEAGYAEVYAELAALSDAMEKAIQ